MNLISYTYKFFNYYLSQIEEIKSIDLYFNQFETDANGETDARANPRVLMEIFPFEPIQGFGKIQQWEGTINFYIGIDITNNFANDSELLETNLAYLDLFDSIYSQMSFKTSDDLPDEIKSDLFKIHTITRNRVEFATNPGPIKVSIISFGFIVEDTSLITPILQDTINGFDIPLEF